MFSGRKLILYALVDIPGTEETGSFKTVRGEPAFLYTPQIKTKMLKKSL